MNKGAMGDDNAERYFNNLCTEAPSKSYEIDCTTETENSGTESDNSNGHSCHPNTSTKEESIPISIQCATVNFHSDANRHLAVSGITASSPDRSKIGNRIVSPSTNEKRTKEPFLSPTSSLKHSSAKDYKCFDVLLTRRKAVKKKQERIDIMTNIISMRSESYIPPSMIFDHEFVHWHCKTTAFAEKPRSWSMEQLAESICEFDVILQKTIKATDAPAEKYPPEITIFQKFMISVYKEAEIAVDEMLHSTRAKIGTQKGQGRIHDNLDMTSLKNDSFDVDNCAYCQHRFVVPIGMDVGELTKFNSKVAKEHHIKLKKWTNTPTKKRGIKPRPGKSMSQHLACVCVKMNCLDKTNGSGCIKCEIACANAIEQGSDKRPFYDMNFECICSICKCECSVIYFRHEAKKLARQRQIDKEKSS